MKALRALALSLALLLTLILCGCAGALLNPGGGRNAGDLPEALRTSPDRFIVVTVENDPLLLSSRAGSTPRAYGGAQIYGASSAARGQVDAIARDYHLSEVAAWPIPVLRVHCVVFEIPEASTQASVLAQLAHEPRVKIAQPLGTFDTMSTQGTTAAPSYNDPYVGLQRGFEQLDVVDAHRWSRGEGVRVAIIDTGIDVSHPELKNRVAVTRNFVDADATQFRHDRHGTEVAGVIASLANNKLGIVGVAPEVKIIALKACWQLDAGADGARCNSFTLAKALVAALDEGAQVVNLSLAGPPDPLLASLVESGLQRGVVFVGSVSPPPRAELSGFPGGAAGVLAVDSAAESRTTKSGVLLAPGDEILTLMPEGHYDFASGSSLATAHVTGTVALLLAQNPKLRPEALQGLLSRTSTRVADRDRTVESINACAAMASLKQVTGSPKNEGGCEQPPRVADRPAAGAAGTIHWSR